MENRIDLIAEFKRIIRTNAIISKLKDDDTAILVAVQMFESAIDLTEAEKGLNYTKDDVYAKFLMFGSITDPNNKASRASFKHINPN